MTSQGRSPASFLAPDVDAALRAIVGEEHVVTDPARLDLLSTDFSEVRLATAAAAVQPASAAEIAAVMRLAQEHQRPVTVRGGGMSYTLGYVPRDPGTILIDMQRMNRILSINLESRFITVEAGATWAQIDAALDGTGLALRFRGTFSGMRATVGGGLGNNATGHGQGDISNDLIGLEVVLPDGRIVQTGARAIDPDLPGVRHSSPDLSGLFINDAGIFGVRTRATFRLSRAFSCFSSVAYGFDDPTALVRAMIAVARLDTATDVLSFGSYHHRVFAAQPRPSPAVARQIARRARAQAGGGLRGLRRLATLLNPAGMKKLLAFPYSLMVSCDAFDPATAERNAAEAARTIGRHGGRKTTPLLAYGLRARPFVPVSQLMLGMEDECTIPTNCTVPLEKGEQLFADVTRFFTLHRPQMERHGITHTCLFLTLGSWFGVEPILYWRDRINRLRLDISEPSDVERLAALPADEEARAFALDLRNRFVTDVCAPLRGAHFQTGKYYPLRPALAGDDNWSLLEDLKGMLDPNGVLNPGGLGIG